MSWRILHGDARDQLATLPERSVQTCVTSPPYFGLRDYGTGKWDGGDPDCGHQAGSNYGSKSDLEHRGQIRGGPFRDVCGRCGATRTDSQIGLETTVDEYVQALVDVFRAVRRVLRDDGTIWLNLGDSYAGSWGAQSGPAEGMSSRQIQAHPQTTRTGSIPKGAPYKAKDLIGVPWRVAFALQADGWYLRSEIIWAKPNPMPESVTDRPTRAHEQVFMLAKQPRYFWDVDAIREGWADERNGASGATVSKFSDALAQRQDGGVTQPPQVAGRNKRSVWTVATTPYAGAHFATFPPKLIEPCILAGSPERACGVCGAPWTRVTERTPMVTREGPGRAGLKDASTGSSSRTAVTGTMLEPPTSRTVGFEPSCEHNDPTGQSVVLDPFAGSGTAGVVALRHNRSFVGVELNAEYVELARRRICDDAPLFNTPAET